MDETTKIQMLADLLNSKSHSLLCVEIGILYFAPDPSEPDQEGLDAGGHQSFTMLIPDVLLLICICGTNELSRKSDQGDGLTLLSLARDIREA